MTTALEVQHTQVQTLVKELEGVLAAAPRKELVEQLKQAWSMRYIAKSESELPVELLAAEQVEAAIELCEEARQLVDDWRQLPAQVVRLKGAGALSALDIGDNLARILSELVLVASARVHWHKGTEETSLEGADIRLALGVDGQLDRLALELNVAREEIFAVARKLGWDPILSPRPSWARVDERPNRHQVTIEQTVGVVRWDPLLSSAGYRCSCTICGRWGLFETEADAAEVAQRHEQIQGFEV